jgi:hypothetical protein
MSDATGSLAEVAYALNLSERQVQILVKDGKLPPRVDGRYPIIECCRAYIGYLRERNAGRGDPDEHSTGQQLARQNIRRASQQADALEIQNAASRKELLPRTELIQGFVGMIETIKAKLKRVPAKVAPSDAPLKDRIARAIEDALLDLSIQRVMVIKPDDIVPLAGEEPGEDE